MGRHDERRDSLGKALVALVGEDNVYRSEPLSKYTSFHVGGAADWLVRVNDATSLVEVARFAIAGGLPLRVVGGGSNILVADAGVAGLVILNRASHYRLFEDGEHLLLEAESGVSLPRLAGELARKGAAGMEWGVGVPGTVGGAVVQNAGAWGHETRERLLRVEVIERQSGELVILPAARLDLRYRASAILDLPEAERPVITRAWFRLEHDDPDAIGARNKAYRGERTATQPRQASGGSTFRNPPGDYAGRLLDAARLKGFRIGDAHFSEKHANFIINAGKATASQIRSLVEHARSVVEAEFGVRLEPEIELVGRWEETIPGAHESRKQ